MNKKHSCLIRLGQQIRKLRKEKGFSQESFAAEVGLDRTYMGGIERGERNIAALNLIRIAKTLKIEVGEQVGMPRIGFLFKGSINFMDVIQPETMNIRTQK